MTKEATKPAVTFSTESAPGGSVTTVMANGKIVGEIQYTRQSSKWWYRRLGSSRWVGLTARSSRQDALSALLRGSA